MGSGLQRERWVLGLGLDQVRQQVALHCIALPAACMHACKSASPSLLRTSCQTRSAPCSSPSATRGCGSKHARQDGTALSSVGVACVWSAKQGDPHEGGVSRPAAAVAGHGHSPSADTEALCLAVGRRMAVEPDRARSSRTGVGGPLCSKGAEVGGERTSVRWRSGTGS